MYKVSGHSDDIVMVEGPGISEEFYPGRRDALYLAFSDGTLLRVEYDRDGIWRLAVLAQGAGVLTKTEGTDDTGTDVVSIDGKVTWVLAGDAFAKVKP